MILLTTLKGKKFKSLHLKGKIVWTSNVNVLVRNDKARTCLLTYQPVLSLSMCDSIANDHNRQVVCLLPINT